MKKNGLLLMLIILSYSAMNACTIFSTASEKEVLVGRNFDWDNPENAGTIWFVPLELLLFLQQKLLSHILNR